MFLSINKISGDLHFQNKLQTRNDFKLNGCKPMLVVTNFLHHRFLMIAMESNDITTVYLTDSDSRDVGLNHISGYPSLNG